MKDTQTTNAPHLTEEVDVCDRTKEAQQGGVVGQQSLQTADVASHQLPQNESVFIVNSNNTNHHDNDDEGDDIHDDDDSV